MDRSIHRGAGAAGERSRIPKRGSSMLRDSDPQTIAFQKLLNEAFTNLSSRLPQIGEGEKLRAREYYGKLRDHGHIDELLTHVYIIRAPYVLLYIACHAKEAGDQAKRLGPKEFAAGARTNTAQFHIITRVCKGLLRNSGVDIKWVFVNGLNQHTSDDNAARREINVEAGFKRLVERLKNAFPDLSDRDAEQAMRVYRLIDTNGRPEDVSRKVNLGVLPAALFFLALGSKVGDSHIPTFASELSINEVELLRALSYLRLHLYPRNGGPSTWSISRAFSMICERNATGKVA